MSTIFSSALHTNGLLVSVQKQFISHLSPTLAEKVISINERGLTSADWEVYNNSTKRTRYSSLPTSDISAETDARGIVKTHSYEPARGLLLGTSYSDDTAPRSYTYNHLGQLTQVTDDAGTRTIGYNAFGEQEPDSLVVDNDTHLITETRDALGRSTGYVYSRNGATQQPVSTSYGADGRINSAGFLHGGAEKQFSYEYLPSTHLLQKLTLPSNMTLTQSYEPQRDLLTGMAYHRGSTLVAQRTYTYDTLGRPLSRSTARSGQTENDCFGYNNRSELTTATVNGGSYAYDYDNIGNRLSSQSSAGAEADAAVVEYTSNELNQYTALAVDGVVDFQPEYDADGNQTRVKTSTGIWAITYDTENRPTDFTSMAADNTITTVHCEYDSMGRRAIKRVMVNGNVTLHQRYIYRGYLQIACIDLTRSHHPALWYITWDPSQNIATRPLAIQKDGSWYTYGWDLTKNICEVFGPAGYLRTAYTYTPYGEATSEGDVTQPIQWSSEYCDTELGLVYYNYRHYNPVDDRWIGRDRIRNFKLYDYSSNNSIAYCDYLGDFDFASEEVKYVYDSGVNEQWGRKASAVTDINFPPIQVKKVPYEKYGNKFRFKFPDQKYVPTITCYKGAGCDERKLDEYIRGSVYPYTTIRKHELHHVDIACQYWNVFVFETKEIENIEYCDEKAAEAAWKYIVKRHIILNSENNIENREFDLSEYALNGDPKMRSRFQSVIREHSNIIMKNANEIISENLYEKTYNPTIDK